MSEDSLVDTNPFTLGHGEKNEDGWPQPSWPAAHLPALLSAFHHLPPRSFLDKFIAVHQKAISRVLLLEKLSAGRQFLRGSVHKKPAKEGLEALHRAARVSTYVKRVIVWGKQAVLETLGIARRFCKNSKKQMGTKRHSQHLLSAYYAVSFLLGLCKSLFHGIPRTPGDWLLLLIHRG